MESKMRLKIILIASTFLLSVSLSSSAMLALFHKAYSTHSCIEGVEIAVHTNATNPLCLDPYELEMACTPSAGSLAGNRICSAISSSDALKENFPLIQNYSSKTNVPGGEQEVIEEGQGIPGGEQEIIEEGQGVQ